MSEYLYKYGNIEVHNRFEEPTRRIFHQWRHEFLTEVNLDSYNVLFMGNSAERIFGISKIPTFDIDIVLSGEIDSYENLSNIFNTAFKLGLNYNLCIDIFHIDVDAFNIEYWDNFTQTRFYDRIVVNGSPDLMIPSKPKKLPHGLYEFDSNKKTPKSLKKHITRVQSGQYLNLRFDLKTMKLISFN